MNTRRKPPKTARPHGLRPHEVEIGDNWAVGMTGLGSQADKQESAYFQNRARLSAAMLDGMYEGDGTLSRIVDHPADEMTRAGFSIESAGGSSFDWSPYVAQLVKQGSLAKIGDALRWARLYGGALLVFDVIDGRRPELPLDLSKVKGIREVVVVESEYARPGFGGRQAAPDVWQIMGNASTPIELVHSSRVIRFDGIKTSPGSIIRSSANGWGPSVLERVWRAVARLGVACGYASNILHEISLPVLRLANLRKTLKEKDGRANLRAIIAAIKDSMDVLHMLAIDKDDEFANVSREVRGIVEIFDVFERDVTACTDMPKEIIFNVTPGGLNTGESAGPVRIWYDRIAKARADKVTPALDRWLEILLAARKAEAPPAEFVFEPLWQPTAAEAAAASLARAQADQIYFTMGAVTADEIRNARFVASNDGGFAVEGREGLEPLEGGELDPTLPAEAELEAADYDPPDTPMTPSELRAKFGTSAAVLKGMHARGEIGAWKFGSRWRYSPSEVGKAGHRPAGSAPPAAAPPPAPAPAPAPVAPPIGARP